MNLFKLQQLTKVFRLKKVQRVFIDLIPLDYHDSWDGDLQDLIDDGTLPANARTIRNEIKKDIKTKLLNIQGENCIYCGIHFEIVGTPEREHIAPKGDYPEFTWINRNIALACHYCNGFEKKSTTDVVSKRNANYVSSVFTIVHPYFDIIKKHIALAFTGADVLISPVDDSPQGLAHIALFELDKPMQNALRGAAYLRQKEINKLGKKQLKQYKKIRLKKYSL